MNRKMITALIALSLRAQTFDVASVKPSGPETRSHLTAEKGRLAAEGMPLAAYIMFAWNLVLSREQLDTMEARLPKWVSTDAFDIQAKAEGNATQDQMRAMLRALLGDRFKLAAHFETVQTPVLALVLDKPGKTGPKLRPHAEGPPCEPPDAQAFPPICGQLTASNTSNHAVLTGERDATLKEFATFVSSLGRLGRPVVDQTGLSGTYDFTLECTPQPRGTPPPDPDAQGITLQEALQEQLGLKLKPTTAPMDTLVVDHVERPSEN